MCTRKRNSSLVDQTFLRIIYMYTINEWFMEEDENNLSLPDKREMTWLNSNYRLAEKLRRNAAELCRRKQHRKKSINCSCGRWFVECLVYSRQNVTKKCAPIMLITFWRTYGIYRRWCRPWLYNLLYKTIPFIEFP